MRHFAPITGKKEKVGHQDMHFSIIFDYISVRRRKKKEPNGKGYARGETFIVMGPFS